MCCFSQPVKFVGGTRIFARGVGDGRQLLAYSMLLETDRDLAMVLPVPVPSAPGDDAVQFVSLEGYASFFDDLERAFPPDFSAAPLARGPATKAFAPKLVVHDVGVFEASFVPTRRDFARLDARFRMPERVFDRLPQYEDWGFVVCRLKPAKRRERIHPLAFSFPRREPDALFFPTVHVHDGSVPETAAFDHMLTCQADGILDATLPWTRSFGALSAHVDATKARGLVDGDRGALRSAIHFAKKNADVVLRPPAGVTLADLRGRGESFRYEIRAENAYREGPFDEAINEYTAAWHTTARTRLRDVVAMFRDGLPRFLDEHRDAWSLAPLDDALPMHFLNGRQLWRGTSHMDGRPGTAGGAGQVAFRIFTKHVEPQDIRLAFAKLPTNHDGLELVVRALEQFVQRGVG